MQMTRDEIVELFVRRQAKWHARDTIALADDYAEDAAVLSPMFGELRGREKIGDSYQGLFRTFPDWLFTADAPLIDGHRVALPFSVTATHVGEFMGLPGTNRHFQIQGVRLFELADGRIRTERRLYDFTGLLIQVGVLKGKPAV
jgi:steroid delta-isomerase-like uncharacterized protein